MYYYILLLLCINMCVYVIHFSLLQWGDVRGSYVIGVGGSGNMYITACSNQRAIRRDADHKSPSDRVTAKTGIRVE